MGKEHRVIIELVREPDGSFSVTLDAGDETSDGYQYMGGLSEGYEFDPGKAAQDAGWLLATYFNDLYVKGDLKAWEWESVSEKVVA